MLTERQFTDAAERYPDMVYRIALNWFRNPVDAEDAAQNAMLRLRRTYTEFQGEDHLRHWLVRVALNASTVQTRLARAKLKTQLKEV